MEKYFVSVGIWWHPKVLYIVKEAAGTYGLDTDSDVTSYPDHPSVSKHFGSYNNIIYFCASWKWKRRL
jgi:hypothetical protein